MTAFLQPRSLCGRRLQSSRGLLCAIAFAFAGGGVLLAQDADRDGLSDRWERGYGRYEIVLGSFTWQQAAADAEARGGHLATVLSLQEWNDLKLVLGQNLHGKNLWLGGTDEGTEGNWRWITGESWEFANWRAGEPGNDSLGNGQGQPEHFLMIWGRETQALDNNQAYWNDATASGGVLARDGYILERGSWTDALDPDTDDDGLADSEEIKWYRAFELVSGSFTWTDAKADAEARGGHLAVITAEAEWQKVLGLVGTSLLTGPFWLGGSDSEVEGSWRWITGEAFNYRRWTAGQPDNLGNEDYLQVRSPNGSWYDAQNTALNLGYILERENAFATDPALADSDSDGLKDGDEARFYRTDPTKPDTDGDSLGDFEELRVWRSNPLVVDTDGDGLGDADEVFSFRTDPTKRDTDGDGFTDRFEVENGSDPLLSSNVPGAKVRAYTAVEIEFDSKAGLNYQIQGRDLPGGSWENIGAKIPGTGVAITRIFTTREFPRRFWRVILTP